MPRYKSWDEHSARWKREHSKAGESRQLWDRWLKLSPAARKSTSIRDYAQGKSIRTQRSETKRKSVSQTLSKSIVGNESIVERGVNMMTPDELRWTASASRSAIARRASEQLIRDKYGKPIPNSHHYKYIRDGWNPWWYKGAH